MREIELVNGGGVAIVSDEDFARVSALAWYRTSHGYARCTVRRTPIYMHRFVMDAQTGQQVDHADQNRLNNTRGNLRFCTRRENLLNSTRRRSRSTYKGVWQSKSGRWNAYAAVVQGQPAIHVGTFEVETTAAHAYDNAMRAAGNGFAVLNFPDVVIADEEIAAARVRRGRRATTHA